MSLETALNAYGYPVLYLGTILEGESFVVIAAVLCQTGHLELFRVVATAMLGALSGDLIFFLAGRYGGANVIQKRSHWQRRAAKATRMLERHQNLVVFSYRFFYGLRAVIPFLIGMTDYNFARFLLLSSAGALVWSVTITVAGLACGKFLLLIISDLQRYQLWFLGGILIVGAFSWAVYYFKQRKKCT